MERKRKHGFTHVWEQASFDPIPHDIRFYVHFRFPDGSQMRRAFTYDWRFWTVPEARERRHETGFVHPEVYGEGTERQTGKGKSIFRRTPHAPTTEQTVGHRSCRRRRTWTPIRHPAGIPPDHLRQASFAPSPMSDTLVPPGRRSYVPTAGENRRSPLCTGSLPS